MVLVLPIRRSIRLESGSSLICKRALLTSQNGLLREIAELREIAQRVYGSTEATDHTEGIFQAIGTFRSIPLHRFTLMPETPQYSPLQFSPVSSHMVIVANL